jgi:hypothetical protein
METHAIYVRSEFILTSSDRQQMHTKRLLHYLHFLVVVSCMRFWNRELQTPIFWPFRVLVGWHVEIRQCLVMCLWKTSLALTGPICVYFILLQIVLFFRKSAINIIGTFCVIILHFLKLTYFIYFYNFGTTSSSSSSSYSSSSSNKLNVYL